MQFNIPAHLTGLTDKEVELSRLKFGINQKKIESGNSIFSWIVDLFKEPMLILLLAVSVIYLIIGDHGEAIFMFLAIVAVSAISFYQDNRSKKALEALEKLNEPLSTVIRNAQVIKVPTHELVVGDLCIVEEGKLINADGKIVHSNDFSVNESSLTGESLSVYKNSESKDNLVYDGTVAVSGLAVFVVEQIGKETRLGKIGVSITEIKVESSPLQIQIKKFVMTMAIFGSIIFLLVCIVNYLNTKNLIESLLSGLTLAMSILPEEIPVAFTTFMALGAWKLMRDGVIIKRSNIVETLGSTTVICTDKTGTITENTMHLKHLFLLKTNKTYDESEFDTTDLSTLIDYAMWSSEPLPFDPMEKTLHHVYMQTQKTDERTNYKMIHEYPLAGKPPMMTHIFENANKQRIIAAKGAPEAIINVSVLSEGEKENILNVIHDFGNKGYRVLGVAQSNFKGYNFPEKQQELKFTFLGLVVFYDPPKQGIQTVFQHIYDAGIKVKVITGDNTETTKTIAKQAGILNVAEAIEGKDVVNLNEKQLMHEVEEKTLFTRMYPEAKLSVVNALKKKGEVVAMLGDGVNDGPALKAAHIGVAMGNKGTEIAKTAASLVITNDDLDKLIVGIAAGRRIYSNLKKAIQYIISIHIPIILTVTLPLFLGWIFPHIFTPVHVIFLELVMGPTCSIVYENEPLEKNIMKQKPRIMTETFLSWKELGISIFQGLAITLGVLFIYQWSVWLGGNEEKTRALVFTTLIFANVFLSLVNRSFYYSILACFKHKNILFPIVIGATLIMLFLILYVPAFADFFKLAGLNLREIIMAIIVAAISVMWMEIYKWTKRRKFS
ncbi:MAG: cation-translocating P-type ATPase [Bacteroidetes bacterium]|nr:cation-translocating P-type ATPase [Bacteroidota bacterium]HRH83284.1 cation-translocating P-type ATPase [Bacteroidia bacterium]